VSNVAIEDKIGRVVPDNIKMGPQEICKKLAPTRV